MKRATGLNPQTIKQADGLDARIDLAARAGSDAVELQGDQFVERLESGHDIADIRGLNFYRGRGRREVVKIAGSIPSLKRFGHAGGHSFETLHSRRRVCGAGIEQEILR